MLENKGLAPNKHVQMTAVHTKDNDHHQMLTLGIQAASHDMFPLLSVSKAISSRNQSHE